MPALVKSRVGSLPGTSELEGTMVWPLDAKKSRKRLRISLLVMNERMDSLIPPFYQRAISKAEYQGTDK
jgi:hypothetical protein